MLQSVKDERCCRGPLKDKPIFLSDVLAQLANRLLPKRLQLDDTQYFLRHIRNHELRASELKRRLRDIWIDLGHPEWADIVTQPLRRDALKRLRASKSGG
jgi:hypothetical protein